VDEKHPAVVKVSTPHRLPPLFLAIDSAICGRGLADSPSAEECFAKAITQPQQESALPLSCCWNGTRAYLSEAAKPGSHMD